MLIKTMAYTLCKCDNCEKWIIYKVVDELPKVCPRCGVPANITLSAQEKQKIEEQNQREAFIRNHGNNQSFNIRFG
jgi:acetyl-CoA carboxylase beta subunit